VTKIEKDRRTDVIKDNAKIQAALLATPAPVLADLTTKGELEVTAGYYALDTGHVTLLQAPFVNRQT